MTSIVARPARGVSRTETQTRRRPIGRKLGLTVGAWVATIVFVLPTLWMVLTSFHHEVDAVQNPPAVGASLTLEYYRELLTGKLLGPLINSLMASIIPTALVVILAIPAAFALAIRQVPKWRDVMFFFLSTKMMPAVAGLLPMYLIIKNLGLLDNIWVLIVLYLAANLPLGIWMMSQFFREIPRELIEAAELDGADTKTILWRVILPMAYPGVAATALISFIFSWNEFLFALNLTATQAYTAPVYLIGFLSGQRLFLAHLCAASVLVSLPVLIAGFVAQDKLVQGLSLGAVK